MTDKQNITIRIANQAPIQLAIDREHEEVCRMAEYNLNRLWNSWSTRFKSKSPTEVLAMVAFRFAELFYSQTASITETEKQLLEFEKKLDQLLLETEKEKS